VLTLLLDSYEALQETGGVMLCGDLGGSFNVKNLDLK